VVDQAEIDRVIAGGRGVMLIVSHLGNVELSRASLDDAARARITLLVHTRHAENYARLLRRFRPEAAIDTFQVTEVNPGTVIALKEVVERGGWVAIAGDRTPVGGGERVSRAKFLGHEAAFPQGPYILAHLLECPVYLMFCLRENGRHRLYFERFAERVVLPRGDKEAALAALAGRYASRLEAYCLRDPFQWYNFFDFWAEAGAR
jgi:predicted LPLAT superfamily acyltransferase